MTRRSNLFLAALPAILLTIGFGSMSYGLAQMGDITAAGKGYVAVANTAATNIDNQREYRAEKMQARLDQTPVNDRGCEVVDNRSYGSIVDCATFAQEFSARVEAQLASL